MIGALLRSSSPSTSGWCMCNATPNDDCSRSSHIGVRPAYTGPRRVTDSTSASWPLMLGSPSMSPGWVPCCPYQKFGTCCGRCRCGPGLIPSVGACPRCSSPCSPPSGPSLGRVSSSRRRFSRSGINSPSSNARRRRDPGLVAPIAYCGCCCRGCGQTGDAPSRSSRPTPSCAGIVAGSRSTGGGNHARDGRAARRWPPTSAR